MFERTPPKPERTHRRQDDPAPQTDPLALDPYSPIFPEWGDPDPMALDPYSPMPPSRRDVTDRS